MFGDHDTNMQTTLYHVLIAFWIVNRPFVATFVQTRIKYSDKSQVLKCRLRYLAVPEHSATALPKQYIGNKPSSLSPILGLRFK